MNHDHIRRTRATAGLAFAALLFGTTVLSPLVAQETSGDNAASTPPASAVEPPAETVAAETPESPSTEATDVTETSVHEPVSGETPAAQTPAVESVLAAEQAESSETAPAEEPETSAEATAPEADTVEEAPVTEPAPERPTPPTVNRRELVTISGNAHLLANEISQEMVTIMGNAIVDGRVRGECVTILGNVTVNGTIDNELVCIMGQVTLGPNAVLKSDLVAVGGKIIADPGAVIYGEKVEIPFLGGVSMPSFQWLGEWFSEGLMWGRLIPPQRSWAWTTAGIIFVLSIIFYLVFRKPVEAAAATLERKPALVFVNGVLIVILFGPLLFLLLVSVIGILVLPFVLAGMFIATIAGMIAVYRYCGGQLGLNERPLLALAAGHAIFIVFYAVLIVGLPILVLTSLMGAGAAITALVDGMRRESRAKSSGPGGPGSGGPRVAPAPSALAAGLVPPSVPGTARAPAGSASGAAVSASVGGIPELPPALEIAERVGFWPRLGATALDFLLVAGLMTFLDLQLIFPYVWLVYHIAFWAWRATTIGGIVLNLRIERVDGRSIDFGVATVRALGSIFSGMVIGLGFMWASWNDERQSWHDKIAGTTIVRVPRGQPLF